MTYRPITLGRDATLAEAARLLDERDFNAIPVTEDGCLVGVVSKLDLLGAFARAAHDPASTYDEVMRQPVARVMRDPVAVGPDDGLADVLQRMVDTGQRSLPVTIGALLIGIVARGDVVRALRRAGATAAQRPRTVRTGQEACRTTRSATLPMSR
jgi:CBS domain-containing protein